jgi:hypothetical protein
MSSLTERAVLLADDVRLDFLEEAREELAGRSRRKWALIAIAFVAGGAATAVGIAFILRRATNPHETSDDGAAAEPSMLARTSESRPWQRLAGNARAGLSTAWNRPSLQ